MKKNEVYVTTDLQDEKLWSHKIKLSDAHWLNDAKGRVYVRTRHRASMIPVKKLNPPKADNFWAVELEEEVRALTPGQSAVFYSGDRVLGGGIVT
jgi:tRNA-specific 2-thiouridylase